MIVCQNLRCIGQRRIRIRIRILNMDPDPDPLAENIRILTDPDPDPQPCLTLCWISGVSGSGEKYTGYLESGGHRILLDIEKMDDEYCMILYFELNFSPPPPPLPEIILVLLMKIPRDFITHPHPNFPSIPLKTLIQI